ncbi:ABC transporter substrate-binding protein [Streptomyces sp. NPDC058464]|uniref:ABC transporter substrate-binding protein n=1 Tax=Streptomyces sp. NPDC058464 TaxID=3346511 RepID=UPI0036692D9F
MIWNRTAATTAARERHGVRGRLRAAALAVALLAVGCGGQNSSTGTSTAHGAPIKVGAMCDMTGLYNFTEACDAAKAYFEKVNSEGGVAGRPIEYHVEDSASNAGTTAQVGTRLVDQTKVVALVGGSNGNQCTQIGRLMAAEKVYALDGQSADSACWRSPYATPLNNGPKLSLAVSAYFMMRNLGGDDVCTMWNSRSDSEKALENLERILKKLTGSEFRKVLEWTGGDLTPLVTQVRQNGCKAVILGGSAATYVSLMQTAANQGMTDGSVVWLGLGTGYTEKTRKSVRADGYWSNSEFLPWSLDTDSLNEFRALQKEHGFLLDSTAESGYTAAKLFVTALKGIKGTIDRQSVGLALKSMKSVSTDGLTAKPFTWGQPNVSGQFLELKNGEWSPYGGSTGKWYTLPASDEDVRSLLTTD